MVALNRPRLRLILLALANLAFLMVCRQTPDPVPAGAREPKGNAVALVEKAHLVLGSRLLGPEYTPITTTLAPLDAKRLSLHPDFAAVAVQLLTDGGIDAGKAVAVNLSGSFPGLNIAVLAAIQAVGARPIIVSSVGASTWGATAPEATWLDLEMTLVEAGIWPWRSAAASLGGVGDRGGGLTQEGLALARQAIQRAGIRAIAAGDVEAAVAQRAEIFREVSGELPAALVNVGGSHVFYGARGHRAPLRQGLNYGYRPGVAAAGGLAALFLAANRPVIHFINIRKMAATYGIQADSPPGGSRVFTARRVPGYIRLLILCWLTVVLAGMGYGAKRGWWQA